MQKMEGDMYSVWKNGCVNLLENLEEEGEMKYPSSLPVIPQPQTPAEPMEFLSRSWSLSASEITKALSQKQAHSCPDMNSCVIPETSSVQQPPGKIPNSHGSWKAGAIGRWFHYHKDHGYGSNTVKKKDRARAENAHLHAALSVAALAAALAAVTAAEKANDSDSKMSAAMASATELVASHCIEIAELAGADHDRVTSVVRSAVDIRSPSDLRTLTAAAATALRGEAALRSRLSKEARKNATVRPYDRPATEAHVPTASNCSKEEQNTPCVGELLQVGINGVVRSKHVSVYINKKPQVMIKIKSKHVGGAFSKKNKIVVYGSCDETTGWTCTKESEDNSEDVYFGLKTAQGVLEFKCKSKAHKQIWLDGIQNLFQRVNCIEATEQSLEVLSINNNE